MKHSTICKNCGAENPFYELICNNCKAFLRTKISNIDFWNTVINLLESPKETLTNIIFSNKKNFLSLVLVLGAIKISLNIIVISKAFSLNIESVYTLKFFYLLLYVVSIIIIFTILITFINYIFKLNTRIKDNIAIYSYSLIPVIISFVILTPVEFALFGNYWFTFNPSPFIIKKVPAYILTCMEFLFNGWSSLLFVISTYVQSKNFSYSFIIGIIFFINIYFSSLLFLILILY